MTDPGGDFATRARRVRLIVLDADGVLTDGGIYVADGPDGRPYGLRRFHVRDGMGVHFLREAGLAVAVVSGKDSPAVRARAADLSIEEVHQVGPFDKVQRIEALLDRHGCGWVEAACLADDLADLAVLERVGLPAAVADAAPEVRRRAVWRSTAPGGRGAVREFAEALLRARGEWSRLVDAYVARGRGRPEGSG